MRILGIDPGYGITGFGLIDAQRGQLQLLRCGAITTPPNTDFSWRLEIIYNDMVELLRVTQPDVVAIEELFFGQNVTTSPCRSSSPWWATAMPPSTRCRI